MARYRTRRKWSTRGRKASSLIGGTGKKVMIGLGAAAAGGILANILGINRMIPAAALGYFGGGGVGLVSAIASDMLTGQSGLGNLFGLRTPARVQDAYGQTTPAGTVYS